MAACRGGTGRFHGAVVVADICMTRWPCPSPRGNRQLGFPLEGKCREGLLHMKCIMKVGAPQ
jgi:hypothetical protein